MRDYCSERKARVLHFLPGRWRQSKSGSGACPSTQNPVEPADHFMAKPEKIGRNEPCPCGSGRKYKKCCLRAITVQRLKQPPAGIQEEVMRIFREQERGEREGGPIR